jgi:hypothetical protein
MEAVAELIAAIVGALVAAVIGLIGAVAGFVAIVVEFIFLALTQGTSAASKQYRHRKEEHADYAKAAKEAAETSANEGVPSICPKHVAIAASIVLCVAVGAVTVWVARDRIRKRRIADTRAQVNKLADQFAKQLKDAEIADPEPGELRDRDAWQEPIELFVDEALLGSLVAVRSSGPDRKSGTIDDLLAPRVVRASVKDVGGELAKRGMQALRDRVAQLTPGGGPIRVQRASLRSDRNRCGTG